MDGSLDIVRLLKINKLGDVVFLGEAWNELLLVLLDASDEVICNASVEGSGAVGHDVDEISFHYGEVTDPSLRSG